MIDINNIIDTGAMIETAKLSVMVEFSKKYPWLVKAIIDSVVGEFQ